jgi:hypothetical protein
MGGGAKTYALRAGQHTPGARTIERGLGQLDIICTAEPLRWLILKKHFVISLSHARRTATHAAHGSAEADAAAAAATAATAAGAPRPSAMKAVQAAPGRCRQRTVDARFPTQAKWAQRQAGCCPLPPVEASPDPRSSGFWVKGMSMEVT